MAYARELQAQGKIRYIGLSKHNPAAAMQAAKRFDRCTDVQR